jgi:hypothetical protein
LATYQIEGNQVFDLPEGKFIAERFFIIAPTMIRFFGKFKGNFRALEVILNNPLIFHNSERNFLQDEIKPWENNWKSHKLV